MKIKTGKILVYSALMGAAFFTQACGSSNNAPVCGAGMVADGSTCLVSGTVTGPGGITSACGLNAQGIEECGVGSTAGASLYSACGSSDPTYAADIALEGTGNGNVTANAVSTQTSPDGTAVCQVTFTQNIQSSSQRYYLGPNAGNSYTGANSGVLLETGDQFAASATGCYSSSSSCTVQITDTQTVATDKGSDDLFGVIQGSGSYFPIYGQVQNVQTQGYLYVGVNQSAGGAGVFQVDLQVQIQRCVDSTGLSHVCPAPLNSTI